MLIAIISDTHLPRGARRLPDACVERIAAADLLLHAGDSRQPRGARASSRRSARRWRRSTATSTAPSVRRLLPAERVVEAGGARIAMVHDAGPARGRLERLRRTFAERADAVVFGHSHMPLHEEARGFQIFNPGSPTERRRAPAHTMGLAHVEDGGLRFELVPLDRSR